jgi:hypothetical protein
MVEVGKHLHAEADDLVGGGVVEVSHEPHAAGVVLEAGIIETVTGPTRAWCVIDHRSARAALPLPGKIIEPVGGVVRMHLRLSGGRQEALPGAEHRGLSHGG